MAKVPLSERDQLLQARDQITRQIEILRCGPVNYRDVTPESGRLKNELEHALAEIEAALAEYGED